MKFKLFFLDLGWISNLLILIIGSIVMLSDIGARFYMDHVYISILIYVISIMNLLFWINNIILWRNKKGSIITLLLLLFFNSIFTLFYYPKNRKYFKQQIS